MNFLCLLQNKFRTI